ncbi:BTAD domain-containing putative transcriptional regulator [Actinomadura rudentiformis]|uniref:AAA family ATPase n=1 Tax=Actinomadura rudentiformis TaxID=359158 RepID=A0A6H9YMG8_9ACTN|nr:BTAD domain-containing putative transcriptional regulator [Actinomadura rudentiformis]KAB2347932.1 AAA family ATPase [Actinomadura rudentiformis]
MRFGVLGPLAVWTADGGTVQVPEAKVRALLADLLVDPGRPVPVDRLADDLWGEDLPANPANSLQSKVSQLRRALEQAEPGARALVAFSPAGYRLRVEAGDVDAGRFAALLDRARGTSDLRARASLFTEALELWRGPAFADFADAPFARAAITRLEEQRLTVLEERAEVRLELGEHGSLADELSDLVARHPLRERLRAVQLRALYRAGRQSEALDGYADLRKRLADELGLDPSPELAELHQAILNQAPALDAVPASAHGARASLTSLPESRLPVPPTGLVGREDDVARAREALGTARLLTLTGPGGVGKTRLALEVATRVADAGDFPDGVWFVELAGRRPDEVAEAVGRVLGIRDDASAGPADRLVQALRDRRLLLVLDNCEHLVEPVAKLVETLLRNDSGLRVLTTSQEPLAIAGEVVQAVPPLPERSAARLFTERASAAAPGADLDGSGTAEVIATICRRLDGIPLALELAATRVRTLGVRGLADRLDDRFRLLAAGRRDAPARQRTLRAMIDWSWELLTEPERIVLRRLAVHAGDCTLEAVEAVCSGAGIEAADVLDLLARLVDRSLVVALDGPGGPRYRLLESVAAYSLEQLDAAGETERVRRRHLAYYLALAQQAEPYLYGCDQRTWLDRLDAETGNLRAALESATEYGAAPDALQLANALTWYWFLRGRYREAYRSLTVALAAHVGSDDPGVRRAAAWRAGLAMMISDGHFDDIRRGAELPVPGLEDGDPSGAWIEGERARALWFLSFVHLSYGDLATSERLVASALADFRAAGDRWGLAAALATMAGQATFRGDLTTLDRAAAESAEIFAGVGDRWGRLQAVEYLGAYAEIVGDYERAARLHEEGVRVAEELSLWADVSYRLSGLGRITMLQGDFERARELHERARRLAEEQSNTFGQEYAEIGLALVARRQGRLDAAEAHLRAWLDWNRRLGTHSGLVLILAELGFTAELRGDAERALEWQREAAETARHAGDPRATALAFEGMAGALSLAGEYERAAESLDEAARLREAVGAPLPPAERGDVERIEARIREGLDETRRLV